MDDMERRPAETSLGDRPTKRLTSARRSVYSDDDLAHRRSSSLTPLLGHIGEYADP
jgi:hypothetical protein